MILLLEFALVLAGFVLLIKGAEWLVAGAASVAQRLGIPELVIGLTIVAFGTSAPELLINIVSSVRGISDFVVGNILGSGMVNIGLGLGLAGLITPLVIKRNVMMRDLPLGLAGLIVFAGLGWWGARQVTDGFLVDRIGGVILLLCFAAIVYQMFTRPHDEDTAEDVPHGIGSAKALVLIAVGIAGLGGGGHLVVENAASIARDLGVSEILIGITIVGIGGSLPEVVTSIQAARRRSTDIAVGNIAGSQIFNIFWIMGVSAAIAPIPYGADVLVDLGALAGITVLLLAAALASPSRSVGRGGAVVLILGYVAYLAYVLWRA